MPLDLERIRRFQWGSDTLSRYSFTGGGEPEPPPLVLYKDTKRGIVLHDGDTIVFPDGGRHLVYGINNSGWAIGITKGSGFDPTGKESYRYVGVDMHNTFDSSSGFRIECPHTEETV